jgi:hypothetical protein
LNGLAFTEVWEEGDVPSGSEDEVELVSSTCTGHVSTFSYNMCRCPRDMS